MLRLRAWGLGAALLVGLSVPAVPAADEVAGGTSARPPVRRNTTWSWSSLQAKPAAKKPPARPDKPADPKPADPKPADARPAVPSAPPSVEDVAAYRAREEAVLLRRLAVCNKLMEVAVQTRDEELLRQVEQIDQRAWAAYTQRTANLSAGSAAAAVDEKILDMHLATRSAAGRHPSPSSFYTVKGKDPKGRATAKEEKP
jgi:hypothetical protein